MAEAAGVTVHLYPNADQTGKKYRAYDMSPVIGGAYRGIVNHALYNGSRTYSMEYEYGFVYGGLFAVGYCQFIHEYCRQHAVDRVLFLSRDGDILEKVYRKLYPDEDAAYVYWSRLAGMKLMAQFDKNDYFRRFIDHKTNQGKTIGQILKEMELTGREEENFITLLDVLHGKHRVSITSGDLLTDKNAPALKAFLQDNFDHVLMAYQNQMDAAKAYYEGKLSGCKKAVERAKDWEDA
jgi:hypothetical protein